MYTVIDKVRLTLEEFGDRDITATVDELAKRAKMSRTSMYQTLHRLEQKNEIEVIKTKDNGHELIIGVRLLKMPRHSAITAKSAEKAIAKDKEDTVESLTQTFPMLTKYLKTRLAIENAKEKLVESGLDPDQIIKFDPDPLAEEAMKLLQKLIDKSNEATELKYERDAAKRDIEFYEKKHKEETQKMLLEEARA